MAPYPNAELLGRVPIFQGLKPYQLNTIARHGTETVFEAGSAILKVGVTGACSYLLLSGFAALEKKFEEHFAPQVLGYGTFLGELAMLVETMFTVTIVARWQLRALALDRETMYKLMEHDPAIAHHFAGKLVDRLQRLAGDLRRADAELATLEDSLDKSIEMVS